MNIYKAKVACEDYNGSDYCLMPRVQARSEEDAQAIIKRHLSGLGMGEILIEHIEHVGPALVRPEAPKTTEIELALVMDNSGNWQAFGSKKHDYLDACEVLADDYEWQSDPTNVFRRVVMDVPTPVTRTLRVKSKYRKSEGAS